MSEFIDSWAIANINISLKTPGINTNTFQFLNFEDILEDNSGNDYLKKTVNYMNILKNEREFIRIPYNRFEPEYNQILYVTNSTLYLSDFAVYNINTNKLNYNKHFL
jgi:hypothetical protein